MGTLLTEQAVARVITVLFGTDEFSVELTDGRRIAVPITWYPRLLHASAEERSDWRLIGNGEGIHWPSLDEDISAENIIFGQPSGESQPSLARWLAQRRQAQTTS